MPADLLAAPRRRAREGTRRERAERGPAEREGCAVLLVEHDVAFVMGLCARVVVLDLGSVLAEGTAAEVRANPLVREAYLGPA
ncbi:hypothetical protein ACFWBI_09490 [Streptomyces sp. NPDC059982]|uniref:ABC transporter ATP-binding protein C-terminal domain-containing protein n=1 Tax=unclassified Streptomyces TaxID=2593676 RepID=UPI00367DFC26